MSAVLVPLSWLYGLGARLHRRCRGGWAALRPRPACAIVSVGAITVGGAGKTPLAARLAAGLHARGWRVVLASRGYKGAARAAVTVVSDGARCLASAAEAGDEALVLAARAPGVPVLVGRDRRAVAHAAVARFGCEILLLDDGFQHHRLARDLDVVALDAHAGLGNGRVLPAGPLREPAASLRHADWICLVDDGAGDGDAPPPGAARWLALHTRAGRPVLRARRRPLALVALDGGSQRPLADLVGRRVGLLSGLARPASFRRTAEALGAQVVRERRFPDHHAYAPRDLRGLEADAELWLTTEKDAVKLESAWLPPGIPLWVLPIELELADEPAVLGALEAALQGAGRLSAAPGASDSTRPDRSTAKRATVE